MKMNMIKNILKGIQISIGFFIGCFILFGIVYAVGFHTADEVLPGIFQGNYTFNGTLFFSDGTNLTSAPTSSNSQKWSNLTIYDTEGTYNFVVPENVEYVKAEVWGSGALTGNTDGCGSYGGINGDSSNFSTIIANGGITGGAGGTANGGMINIPGNSAGDGSGSYNYPGRNHYASLTIIPWEIGWGDTANGGSGGGGYSLGIIEVMPGESIPLKVGTTAKTYRDCYNSYRTAGSGLILVWY